MSPQQENTSLNVDTFTQLQNTMYKDFNGGTGNFVTLLPLQLRPYRVRLLGSRPDSVLIRYVTDIETSTYTDYAKRMSDHFLDKVGLIMQKPHIAETNHW